MRRYTFLLSLLLLPSLLMAQGRNLSIAPKPDWLLPYQPDLSRKPDLKDVSDGYYQVLYEEQRHLEKQTIYRHVIRQIVSEVGIQNGSEINAEYNPEYEKLQFHTIVIRRNGQVINRLDPSKFKVLQQETELSRFIYSGIHNAYFIVEDVRKGDQIEYAYSITGENPIFQNRYCRNIYFTAYEPIMNFYKSLITSPTRPLHFKKYSDAPEPVKKTANGMLVYEWDLKDDVHVMNTDAHEPDWYTGYPHTEVSEFSNWAEVATWGRKVTTVPSSGPAVGAHIAQLKKDAKGDTAQYIIEAIRFVQDDIRYMGIEMGEYSHRPNTPDKVCKQRFGDCKDKALLLCTLLHAMGIEANMALVSTERRDKVAERLPSTNQFNHVIAQFRFRGKTYWTDATASYQRGKLEERYNPEYGIALVLTDTTTGLTRIPMGETGKITCEEVITLPNTRNEYAQMKVRTKYTGYHADVVRNTLASDSRNGLQTSYEDFYEDLYGTITLVDSLKVEDDEVNNIIVVKESYKIVTPWKQDSLVKNKYVFNTSAHMITDKIVTATTNRKSPLALSFPVNVEQTIRVEFPENWSLNENAVSAKTNSYNITFKPDIRDNIVTLPYRFQTLKDHVPLQEVAAYVQDMKKINSVTGFTFTWTPGGTAKAKTGHPGGLNWMAAGMAFLCLFAFTYCCKQYYRRSVEHPYADYKPWNISGFMIVIAIIVVLYPVVMFSYVMTHDNFQDYYWVKLYTANPGRNISGLQFFMLAEVVLVMFTGVLSVFVAVLFFQRRDLFPRTFSFLLVFHALTTLVDYLIADYVLGTHQLINHNSDFIVPLVLAGICVPYLLNSERSKRTFVIPYENGNGAW